MELTDTHCHIHSKDFPLNPDEVINNAKADGVIRLICVGLDVNDSELATQFVVARENCFASIGIHPHEAQKYTNLESLDKFNRLATKPKVVAIGECGLDYYYLHSAKEAQISLLEYQLNLATKNNLPLIFHVRDAFDDFWPIFDNFSGIRGVIHSFTADSKIVEQALSRGLYMGLNGIMTFTKDAAQLTAARTIPDDKLLLETDSPYLTPVPFRGKVCQPKYVKVTAEFLAELRSTTTEMLAKNTTKNAIQLFNL